MTPRRSATGRAIIALAVVVIVVIAAAFLSLSQGPSTSSTQSASSSTNTTGQSSTSLSSVGQSSVSSGSQSSAVSTSISTPAECSGAQPPTAFPTVFAGGSSPAIICVQFYYFNSTGSLTLNLTNGLSILAAVPGKSFDGGSNFTVTSSQAQLVLGGPGNESEGAVVAFAVTAKPGASGTYELSLLRGGSNEYVLGSQEPETCGSYGQLVAGGGQPNYVYQFGGCLTYATVNTSYSPSYTLAGVPYPLLPGDIFFRMVGVANSTG